MNRSFVAVLKAQSRESSFPLWTYKGGGGGGVEDIETQSLKF